MNKYKIIVIILVIFLLMNINVYCNTNEQYIVTLDDSKEIMDRMIPLYIDSNYALPSMSAPYSVSELSLMLEQVDYSLLNKSSKKKYNFIKEKLNNFSQDVDNDLIYNVRSNINVETYFHINESEFINRESWFRGWSEQKNFFDLNLELYADTYAYALSDFSFGLARVTKNPFGSSSFQLNIPGFTNFDLSRDTDSNIPQRAFMSFGGENWNLQFGRDKINWGAGVSSNLLISDNLKYQDFAKFSLFGSKYKYTYLASFFPHQSNYFDDISSSSVISQLDELKGFSMFVVHRFEGRSKNNRFGWALSEGLMYASEDSTIDFRAFNPMLSYHSLFAKANCNSILSLDLDFTFNNNSNIYSQIVIDDLVVPFTETTQTSYSPNAIGFLVGYKKIINTILYSLISNFEIAYTSPYLYLRDNGNYFPSLDIKQSSYGINFIVALREFSNSASNGIIYDKQFLGFKYGGDALVFNFNNNYIFNNNKLKLELNIFSMVHGVHDINTLWSPVGGDVEDPGFLALFSSDNSKKGLSFSGVVGLSTQYIIDDKITIFSQLDFISLLNYDHNGSNSNDIQLTCGFSASL